MTPTRSSTAALALAAALVLVPSAAASAALHPEARQGRVEPGVVATAGVEPGDPSLADRQWNLRDHPAGLGAARSWELATGAGQTVAVVDTGITAHPDLDAGLLPGYDFVSAPEYGRDGDGRDADPTDMGDHPDAALCPGSPVSTASTWHGTHTAGIAAARAGNGVAGVAPDAGILPVRVVGACSQGSVGDLAAGITWASGAPVAGAPRNPHPASVINLSLGVPGACPAELQRAVDEAVARGIPVVAAAGNQALDAAQSAPANCAGVISVAATDADGALAAYSNFGAVTVAAPGGSPAAPVLSTGNAGTTARGEAAYTLRSGTSGAAAAVSGVVALLRQHSPALSVQQIRDVLTSTARQPPGGCAPGCGAGLVDPVSALVRAGGGEPFGTGGGIGVLHERLGGGEPRSRELCAVGGTPCLQEFEDGWIVWHAGRGARWHGTLPSPWWAAG